MGQHLLDSYQGRIEVAQHQHGATTVKLRWTPGHEGIAGNARADEEAKRASGSDSGPACMLTKSCRGPVPLSGAAARQRHLKSLRSKATDLFTKSPRSQWLRYIDPLMPLPRFRKSMQDLLRDPASLLVQLCTGHIPLQK